MRILGTNIETREGTIVQSSAIMTLYAYPGMTIKANGAILDDCMLPHFLEVYWDSHRFSEDDFWEAMGELSEWEYRYQLSELQEWDTNGGHHTLFTVLPYLQLGDTGMRVAYHYDGSKRVTIPLVNEDGSKYIWEGVRRAGSLVDRVFYCDKIE